MHVEGNRRVKFEGNPGDPFRTRGHRDLHAKRLLYSDTYKGCHKRFTCIFTRYDHPKSVPRGIAESSLEAILGSRLVHEVMGICM